MMEFYVAIKNHVFEEYIMTWKKAHNVMLSEKQTIQNQNHFYFRRVNVNTCFVYNVTYT